MFFYIAHFIIYSISFTVWNKMPPNLLVYYRVSFWRCSIIFRWVACCTGPGISKGSSLSQNMTFLNSNSICDFLPGVLNRSVFWVFEHHCLCFLCICDWSIAYSVILQYHIWISCIKVFSSGRYLWEQTKNQGFWVAKHRRPSSIKPWSITGSANMLRSSCVVVR